MAKKIKPANLLTATSNGYADLWRCRSAVGAYTLAVLAELDLVRISDKGSATKGKAPLNKSLLRAMCRPTMVAHWTKVGRLDDSGLTVKGLNEVTERLTNQRYAYRTTVEAVGKMREGLRTGKPVELEGATFKLEKLITVKPGF